MDSLSGTKEETSQISQSSVNVAANDDKVAKLKKLWESDLISQEEFETQMSKLQ